MTLSPMTRQDVPPLLTLSGAVLEAEWDRVGHITLSDRCRRTVGGEKKNRHVSFSGHAPYCINLFEECEGDVGRL